MMLEEHVQAKSKNFKTKNVIVNVANDIMMGYAKDQKNQIKIKNIIPEEFKIVISEFINKYKNELKFKTVEEF